MADEDILELTEVVKPGDPESGELPGVAVAPEAGSAPLRNAPPAEGQSRDLEPDFGAELDAMLRKGKTAPSAPVSAGFDVPSPPEPAPRPAPAGAPEPPPLLQAGEGAPEVVAVPIANPTATDHEVNPNEEINLSPLSDLDNLLNELGVKEQKTQASRPSAASPAAPFPAAAFPAPHASPAQASPGPQTVPPPGAPPQAAPAEDLDLAVLAAGVAAAKAAANSPSAPPPVSVPPASAPPSPPPVSSPPVSASPPVSVPPASAPPEKAENFVPRSGKLVPPGLEQLAPTEGAQRAMSEFVGRLSAPPEKAESFVPRSGKLVPPGLEQLAPTESAQQAMGKFVENLAAPASPPAGSKPVSPPAAAAKPARAKAVISSPAGVSASAGKPSPSAGGVDVEELDTLLDTVLAAAPKGRSAPAPASPAVPAAPAAPPRRVLSAVRVAPGRKEGVVASSGADLASLRAEIAALKSELADMRSNMDKYAAAAAARVIREEIAALAETLK
ncbi:MAG: hypothetical protein LBQ63_03585 [Deltaproteobacteria bacterium]|nr:hypothetical protein [Deltaproteobacteria bacterium]